MPNQSKQPRTKPEGFDITRVVGRVTFGEGERSANEEAFSIIARDESEGTYTFPLGNGNLCHVTVDYETPEPETSRPEEM